MPEPRYSDRELLLRAQDVLEAVVRVHAGERGRGLSLEDLRIRMGRVTIAITEVLLRGQYSYIITSNSSAAYNALRRNSTLLRSFEILGDPNVNVYPKPTPEEVQAARLAGRSATRPRAFTRLIL